MSEEKIYEFGPQPVGTLMAEHGLKPSDLVRSSGEQLTHKMISRAVKGRRLTANVQNKILRALNKAANKEYQISDIFTY